MTAKMQRAASKAARTAKWATTMAKWGVSHAAGGHRKGSKAVKGWQLVDFPGPNGAESKGIVDALAVRKDHGKAAHGLGRGDRLEIILLQIKGGRAVRPSSTDIERLRRVKRLHGASEVVLVEWDRQKKLTYSRLKRGKHPPGAAWEEVKPQVIFGSGRPRRA